jgi:DME family drug/metabolite transporter
LYGVAETSPLSIGFFRLAIATPVLWVVGWNAIQGRMFQVTGRDFGLMALIGVLMAFYQVSFFTAIQTLGAAIATLITLCTAPAIVAALSAVITKEKLTRRILAALVCALVGTALLIQIQPGSSLVSSWSGVGWALCSAFGYACMTVVSQALAGRYHPVQSVAIGLGVGAILLLFTAGVSGLTISYSLTGWGLLIYLGVVPTALAFGLFLTGMRHTTATVASIATLLEPLTSAFLAWLIFNEQLSPLGAVGAALLCGAMLLLWRR